MCMKDYELCASTWLQPTNAEFVSMRFFLFVLDQSQAPYVCPNVLPPTKILALSIAL